MLREARGELGTAIKHCKRATSDAYEAAILNPLMAFKKSKEVKVSDDCVPLYSGDRSSAYSAISPFY